MTEPINRTKLKAAELEALIMNRLGEHSDCSGIIQVFVKASGRAPPDETWTHTLISRRPTVPKTQAETTTLHTVLNAMRKEFDLVPGSPGQRR
jgi:hypothetical protein